MKQPATLHVTGLDPAVGRIFKRVAQETGYSFDAILFVTSALGVLTKGPPGPGEEDRWVEGQPTAHHVTARELCDFLPHHAVNLFKDPVAARGAVSSWGLRRGEDVGAIVMGLLAAGWGSARPNEGAHNFRGLEIPEIPVPKRPWWKFW